MRAAQAALIATLGIGGGAVAYYLIKRSHKKPVKPEEIEVSEGLVEYVPKVRSFLKSLFGPDAKLKSLIEYVEGTPIQVTKIKVESSSLAIPPASVEIKFTINSNEYVISMPKYFFVKLMKEKNPKEYFFTILWPRIRPLCRVPIP